MSGIYFPDDRPGPETVGAKAATLARLADLAPVPPWVAVTAAAVDETGLRADTAQALTDALVRLGPGPYAVRSSGGWEDGAGAAHAGQFLTLLSVPASDVLDAVMRVWRSGFAETVRTYQASQGLTGAPEGISVLVQRQLAPRVAGVVFSADPLTGNRAETVISAVAGLGDRLMAGEVDGQAYRIAATGPLIEYPSEAALLTEAEAQAIAALARACAGRQGYPQDVEWAIEGETLYLLQSRPITALPVPDETLTIWDNSNIVESYPGVSSVLTYSFARHVYAHVYRVLLGHLGVPGAVIAEHRAVVENLLGRIDGRIYYNLLNWYRLLVLLPGFALNRRAMEQMMGVAEALPDEIAARLAPLRPQGIARIAAYARLARVGVGLVGQSLWLPRKVRRFYRRLETALSDTPDFTTRSLSDLAQDYRRLEAALLERWDAPLLNDLICMIAFAGSRAALTRWAGEAGTRFHADVMVGQGDIVSAEPAQRIRAIGVVVAQHPDLLAQMAKGDAAVIDDPRVSGALTAYLTRFGDRCPEELKLESIPFGDDPTPLLRAIAAAATAQGRTQSRELPSLVPLISGRFKRFLAARLLAWAKARVRDRENLRLERTRVFARVRRIVRAMGARLVELKRLEKVEDVFHLTIDELLGAIEGGGIDRDLKALVVRRQQQEAIDRAKADPPERMVMQGAALLDRRGVGAATPAPETSTRRQGTACAPGVVTGIARVITDPTRQSLAPGEILVARHTDPGWIVHFASAAAIIVERGSLLSHSAIVARELGIPCIVGLKGATSWLLDGNRITLDGASGWVEVLND
jgi:pyruvate,water dikinase